MSQEPLDDGARARLRSLLERQKRRLTRQMERMWQSGLDDAETGGIGELSLYDQHPADLGSELAARQTDFGLQQNIERLLDDVERALKRIEAGTYGVCERCGRPIPEERLRAIPYATACVDCQEQADQERERQGTLNAGRPVEETVMTPPFGRTFHDGDDYTGYDGEDTWQDLARYGTSNTPSDEPGSVHISEAYTDADEAIGIVEPVEAVIDIGGRGVIEADIFPDPDHVQQRRQSRHGAAGIDGMPLGLDDDEPGSIGYNKDE